MDALSQRYVLNTLNTRLLGFKHVKEFYVDDDDFGQMYRQCEHLAFDKYFRHVEFLVKDKRLCMSKYSLCKLLVRQAHKGSLMGHFRFAYI
jgi:hypothetical protein